MNQHLYRTDLPDPGRRTLLSSLLGITALGATGLGLLGCARDETIGPKLAADAALPTTVPPGVELIISIHVTHKQLEAAGLLARLPFKVADWPNVVAGPDVIQGFRARSIDVAANAGIPPIQAEAIGFDARIVAVATKPRPIYEFATAPGSAIGALADLRGKKIAFSQGQAQGVVVLRTLKELGLTQNDVTLIPLNSPQFLTALQSGQVDVAPLGEPTLTKYLTQYRKDGARGIAMSAVDYLTVLWSPAEVLADEAKAAAVRAFVPFWAQAQVWAWEHQDAWINHYYVKDQGVTAEDGRRIVAANAEPRFPTSWDKAIAWQQETIDLLAEGGYVPSFGAGQLFDRRFERVAADAVPAAYRE